MKNTYKKLSLMALAMLLAVACTSKKYDLENINTEITLGGAGIVAPIGHIAPLTLDSLFDKLNVDILEKEENGDLKIGIDSSFTFSIDAINIDPISDIIPELEPIEIDMSNSNFSFPENGFSFKPISYNYDIDIPEYDINDTDAMLPDFEVTVATEMDLDILQNAQANIFVPAGLVGKPTVSGTREVNLSFPCPEQVKGINKIWFDNGGADFVVSFNFNSLASVTDQRTINSLIVNLPEGYVIELDNDLNGTATITNGNKLVISNYNMGSASGFSIKGRLVSVDMSHITPVTKNGKLMLEYNDQMSYDLQCTFTTKSGTLALSEPPGLNIKISESHFGDAEIITNEIKLDPIQSKQELKYELAGMSPDVAAVKRVSFVEGSDFTLIMTKLDLPFVGWGDCQVNIDLPECFVLDQSKLNGATISGNRLSTTIKNIEEGIILPIAKLDFGESGAPVIDEKLIIESEFAAEIIPVFPSATYLLSDITPAMGSKSVFVGLENSHLYIDMENSQVVLHQMSSDISFEEVIEQTIDNIPSELKRIETLSVADVNGEPITLNMAISIDKSPIDHVKLSELKIDLPKCLWIEAEGLDENNTITIDQINVDIVNNKIIELLEIKVLGIKDLDVVDGKINISDKVSIIGKAIVPEGDIIHGTLDDVVITPAINIPTMFIKDVVGRVNIDLGKYVEPQSFDLSELSDALNSDKLEANLGIKAPNILLEVSNPIGVSVDATLNLTATYPQGEPLALYVPIHLNGATQEGDGITKLCLTANPALAPAGYTAVSPDGYECILEKIPSAITFSIEGGVDESQECFLSLGTPYDFNLNLSAQIPFEFNGNTNIRYKDSFDVGSMFQQFGEFGIEVGEVGILLNAQSTLPFELEFAAQAVDSLNQPLSDIQIFVDGGIKASTDGVTAQSSQLFIGFRGNSNALSNVNAINFELRGSTGGKEGKLNSNQYVAANAILKAKDGITIDIKKLLEDMTTEDEEDDDEGIEE